MSGVCECIPWDSDAQLNSGGCAPRHAVFIWRPRRRANVTEHTHTLTRSWWHSLLHTQVARCRHFLRSIASPDTSGHREGAVKHRARFCLLPSGVVGLFVPASAAPCYGVTMAAQSSRDRNSLALLSSHEATVMHAVRCCPEPRDVAHDRIARWRLSLVSRLRTAEFSPAGH